MGYTERTFFSRKKSDLGHLQECPICKEESVKAYLLPLFNFWLYNCQNCGVTGNVVSFFSALNGISYDAAYSQLETRNRDFLEAKNLFDRQGSLRDIVYETKKYAKNNTKEVQKLLHSLNIGYDAQLLEDFTEKFGVLAPEHKKIPTLGHVKSDKHYFTAEMTLIPDLISSICIFNDDTEKWIVPQSLTGTSKSNSKGSEYIPSRMRDYGFKMFDASSADDNKILTTNNPKMSLILEAAKEISGASYNTLLFNGEKSFYVWDKLKELNIEPTMLIHNGINPSINHLVVSNVSMTVHETSFGEIKSDLSEKQPKKVICDYYNQSKPVPYLIHQVAMKNIEDEDRILTPLKTQIEPAYEDSTVQEKRAITARWRSIIGENVSTEKNLYYRGDDNKIYKKHKRKHKLSELIPFSIKINRIIECPTRNWVDITILSHVKPFQTLVPMDSITDTGKGALSGYRFLKKFMANANRYEPNHFNGTSKTASSFQSTSLLTDIAYKISQPTKTKGYERVGDCNGVLPTPFGTFRAKGFDSSVNVIPPLKSDAEQLETLFDAKPPNSVCDSDRRNILTLSKFLSSDYTEKSLLLPSKDASIKLVEAFNPGNVPIKGYIVREPADIEHYEKKWRTNLLWEESDYTITTEKGESDFILERSPDMKWYPSAVKAVLTYKYSKRAESWEDCYDKWSEGD